MITKQGLNSTEMQTFSELLVMANKEQLDYMVSETLAHTKSRFKRGLMQ